MDNAMTITKRTLLDQCAITQSRNVIGDFCLFILDDGVVISKSAPHTINIAPNGDYAATLKANNADITTRPGMMWPAIDADEWKRFIDHCLIAHTPEVVAAYIAAINEKKLAHA